MQAHRVTVECPAWLLLCGGMLCGGMRAAAKTHLTFAVGCGLPAQACLTLAVYADVGRATLNRPICIPSGGAEAEAALDGGPGLLPRGRQWSWWHQGESRTYVPVRRSDTVGQG